MSGARILRAVLCTAAAIIVSNLARADEGALPCEMGTQKWDPNTAVCVPRQPANWVGCTGVPWSGKGGQWKETGIPCSKPPPKSAAEYIDTTEVPHPPLAPDAKRVIDLFRGVLFTCVPEYTIGWTIEACAQIEKEWKRQANATNLPNAVLDAGGDEAAKQKKADVAGIPPGGAVEWKLWFVAGHTVVATLKEEMTAVLEVLPGIYGRKAILVGGEMDIGPDEAKPAFALAGAKREIEDKFKFLLGPR